jgi:predicted enzyme related to lactoylglutathione lyase
VVSVPTYSFTGLTPPALGETIDVLVADAKERMRAIAGVEGRAVYGLPGEELASFGGDVDLLVVGSRNYGPLRRLVLGSTSDYLERHARCSLLVLPRQAPRKRSMSATAELITGVDFAAIPTHDIEAAVQFYGTTLGLRCSVYSEDRHYAEFETGNLTLSVIDAEAMGLEHHVQHHQIALHVEDVAAARKALEERGVTFHGDTLDTGVCHMALFNDLDGNALMLHHRYAPRN